VVSSLHRQAAILLLDTAQFGDGTYWPHILVSMAELTGSNCDCCVVTFVCFYSEELAMSQIIKEEKINDNESELLTTYIKLLHQLVLKFFIL